MELPSVTKYLIIWIRVYNCHPFSYKQVSADLSGNYFQASERRIAGYELGDCIIVSSLVAMLCSALPTVQATGTTL